MSFPDTVGIVFKISEVGKHQAIVGVVSTGLVSPGPALTPGLVLDISPSLLRWITNVVFVNYNYPAESPALFIVRDRSEDIQHGGVSPALVNLENKEISSVAIMMLPLIPCNKRKCQSSSLPSSERRIGNLTMIKYKICNYFNNY